MDAGPKVAQRASKYEKKLARIQRRYLGVRRGPSNGIALSQSAGTLGWRNPGPHDSHDWCIAAGAAGFKRKMNWCEMLPKEIIDILGLAPATCGFVSEPYRSALELPASVLPAGYVGKHSLGNVLYFLVTHDAGVELHRIRSDQMYHHYLGDPLEVLLLYADGKHEVRTVGADLAAGMRPQLFVPGGTFHAARVASPEAYALLGTSVWLRAEPADVEMGDAEQLIDAYPLAKSQIELFAK